MMRPKSIEKIGAHHCHMEFFASEFTRLCKKQADEDVAGPHRSVVVVLRSCRRHGIQGILPANDPKILSACGEGVIQLPQVKIECITVRSQFIGRREKNVERAGAGAPACLRWCTPGRSRSTYRAGSRSVSVGPLLEETFYTIPACRA
jgi:hypothetical protein